MKNKDYDEYVLSNIENIKNKEDGNFRHTKNNELAGYRHPQGYIYISIGCNKRITAHRLAWLYEYGELPNGVIDHINHDRADNRICNLRDVTNLENHKNRKMHSKNTSGATGVHFNNKNKKYRAYICVKGKRKHLGMFENLEDAVKAREKAQKEFNFHKNSGR